MGAELPEGFGLDEHNQSKGQLPEGFVLDHALPAGVIPDPNRNVQLVDEPGDQVEGLDFGQGAVLALAARRGLLDRSQCSIVRKVFACLIVLVVPLPDNARLMPLIVALLMRQLEQHIHLGIYLKCVLLHARRDDPGVCKSYRANN